MTDEIIEKMASDLGIRCFSGEEPSRYKCRVIYSAMASWLKAISLDQTFTSAEANYSGVSRKYLYERSRAVYGAICKMFPEITGWFEPQEDKKEAQKIHPMILLRTRLVNHGDLVNAGFKTNFALSPRRSIRLTSKLESVLGNTLGSGLCYAGVAMVRNSKINYNEETLETAQDWLNAFLHDAWWSKIDLGLLNTSSWQYFNPSIRAKNNYSAWQSSPPDATNGVTLARTSINNNSHEYYLLKSGKLLSHKLDPFLKERGYHIRLMYALRERVNNSVVATAKKDNDHVFLQLNARLPANESALLQSYAWPDRNIHDKLWWHMSVAIWDYIKPHIESLGIMIQEKKHG